MAIVHRAVLPLRALLALTFVLLVVFQTLSFPGQFAHMAEEHPQDADLRWPATIFVAVLILCMQVVIVCTWKLLTMVEQDRIFTEGAFRWVDLIVGAIGAAWLLLVGAWVFVGVNADDPGMPLVLTFLLLGVGALGMLMVVMRALLHQATSLRSDLEGVI